MAAGSWRPLLAALTALAGLAFLPLVGGTSAASTASAAPTLVYDYHFGATTGSVTNVAPGGPRLALGLHGSWTALAHGTRFAGDTAGNYAIGFAVPKSGYTLNVPATSSVGFGARFVYQAPATGRCFGDTPNITQIGRFAADSAQAKLQLSKCHDYAGGEVLECRFSGAKTASSVDPVISSLALVGGDTYDATCLKSPDGATGLATVTLSVVDRTRSRSATRSFTVAALGALRTKQAISVANKYPLPAAADNTDQFVGVLDQVIYCTGTKTAVAGCLARHL